MGVRTERSNLYEEPPCQPLPQYITPVSKCSSKGYERQIHKKRKLYVSDQQQGLAGAMT